MLNVKSRFIVTGFICLALAALVLSACDEREFLDFSPVPSYELRVVEGLALQSYVDGVSDAAAATLTGNATLVDDGGRLVINTGNGIATTIAGQSGVDLPAKVGEILKSSGAVSIELYLKIPESASQANIADGTANPLFTFTDGGAYTDRVTWVRPYNMQWWFYYGGRGGVPYWGQCSVLPIEGSMGTDAINVTNEFWDGLYHHYVFTKSADGTLQMYVDGELKNSGKLDGAWFTQAGIASNLFDTDLDDFSTWGAIGAYLGKTMLNNGDTCEMHYYSFAVYNYVLNSIDVATRKDILTHPGAFSMEDIQ